MRRLTEADRRVWEAYRHTADPLDRARRDLAVPAAEAQRLAPPPKRVAGPPPLAPFRVGQAARTRDGGVDRALPVADALRAAPVTMDAKAYHRMRAGKLRPEAKLDLHGKTLETAHPTLIDFVMRARGQGKRLLLVVTGKGRRADPGGPMPARHGVLRHQVPQWLRMPPLGGLVLQVSPAHRTHGGEGAYYVYLRRG